MAAAPPKTMFGNAPPGYVPGLGRGAVGFTTRSDIGPAGAAAVVKAPPGFEQDQKESKATDYSEANYDEFSGFSENLFAGVTYDKEDEEADLVYLAIDQRMDTKRKQKREELLKEEMLKYRNERPRISEQFRDLKRGLGELDKQDWEAIPEPKDYSRQNALKKKKAREKLSAVPDHILIQSSQQRQHNTEAGGSGFATPLGGVATPLSGMCNPTGFQTPVGGMATPLGYATPMGSATPLVGGPTDYTQLGRARDKVLSLKLDRMADSVSGQTVVDPKGYLTDLNHIKVSSDAEVSDIKKARLLLKSVITTNPKHGPGWIAAARLEEETGKLAAARQVIMKGCEVCPTNEDVWIEACRLSNHKNAKVVLAKAVAALPTSVKIWMHACKLEEDLDAKKAVLRRALELIPNSVVLWKTAVGLEEPDDAKVMLGRAVELVPESVEMWLALARLETYENAKKVLNKAREALPTEPSIWITAAKLEEANGNNSNVDIIIQKAVKSLAAHQVIIDRDAWLHEAQLAEKSNSVVTCQAIVRATIGLGVEEQDQKNTWLNDADHYLNEQSIETARAIFAHMLGVFPGKKAIWLRAAQLERQYGTRDSLDQILRKAVQYCPQAETLWLMAAKERWLANDVPGARAILNSAFAANPDSEKVWLAAVKLESENDEYERARMLLTKARDRAGTARVWMKSAKLERRLGNTARLVELLDEALRKYPKNHKLWIMKAQHEYQNNEIVKARNTFKEGIKQCPSSPELAYVFAEFELETSQAYSKARSILETARLKIPGNPLLYLHAIRVEEREGNTSAAQQLMAKALQECPTAGILWAHAIATDPRPLRKARSYDALKRCTDDPHVFLAVAKLFWLDRKVSKARNWMNRAVTVDPDLGDAWAWFYKFEQQVGGTGAAKKLRMLTKRCVEADPRHGVAWTRVSKDIANVKETVKPEDILKQVVEALPEDPLTPMTATSGVVLGKTAVTQAAKLKAAAAAAPKAVANGKAPKEEVEDDKDDNEDKPDEDMADDF